MDWSVLSTTVLSELDRDDDLVSEVFKFLLGNNLPAQPHGRLVPGLDSTLLNCG